MKAFPAYLSKNDYSLSEIFLQEEYTNANPEKKNEIKIKSAQFRYDYETEHCLIERKFLWIRTNELHGKSVLDLGCFTGGRLVYWKERYKFGETKGIDIEHIYEEAGRLFAKKQKVDIEFQTGFGEDLPYESNSFDYIISYDVFEHVCDVGKVMKSCFRVLKPGGRLLVIFPQYLQPFESHLGFVTRLPALQWFFTGKTITEAAYEIHCERGNDADWYALKSPYLEEWERLPSLNGISITQFRRIVKKNRWKIIYQNKEPILSSGRRAQSPILRILKLFFLVPARLPLLEELFLDRVCFILEK